LCLRNLDRLQGSHQSSAVLSRIVSARLAAGKALSFSMDDLAGPGCLDHIRPRLTSAATSKWSSYLRNNAPICTFTEATICCAVRHCPSVSRKHGLAFSYFSDPFFSLTSQPLPFFTSLLPLFTLQTLHGLTELNSSRWIHSMTTKGGTFP